MEIYIIVGSLHYVQDNVIACFDSKKAAMEYVEKESGYDSYDISICNMNDESEGFASYDKESGWRQFHSALPLEVKYD